MKQRRKPLSALIFSLLLVLLLSGCSRESASAQEEEQPENTLVTVGFSQVGAESDWRDANSRSMREAFTRDAGYELLFEDGQQKQSNQIRAIRTFIQQEVDYIVLAPVTETGWDTVLSEAEEAGIPVILLDRMVDAADESAYVSWVGSDFALEGRKACEWLRAYTEAKGVAPESVNLVNIQGTIGATAQIGRTQALREAAEKNGWNLKAEISGDFTQTKGQEVMASLLHLYSDINVVYCENDNEALGAIEAIEEAGKTVGTDIGAGEILVISFDGVGKSARTFVSEGKIACIAQCNPDQGAMARTIIEALEAGETPQRRYFREEGIFSACPEVRSVTVDGTEYPVVLPEETGE